jgi:hypothetical protein
MFAHISKSSADSNRQETMSFPGRLNVLAAVVLGLLTAACAQMPASPFIGPDPSNPQAAVRPVTYRSTVAGYTSQLPVEPRPWLEQHERITPAPSR